LGRMDPPSKVRKSATSAPDPKRLKDAKLAVPAFMMNLVTAPLELLNSIWAAPTLVIVPAYRQLNSPQAMLPPTLLLQLINEPVLNVTVLAPLIE